MKSKQTIKNDDWNKLLRFFDCYENVEAEFNIDISCGDGLFLPDIKDDPDILKKYDGNVDLSMVRLRSSSKIIKGDFKFSFNYDDNPSNQEFTKCTIIGGNRIDIKLNAAKIEIEKLKAKLKELTEK